MCLRILAQNICHGETSRTLQSFSMAEGKEFSIETTIGKYEYTENQMISILEWFAPSVEKCGIKALHPSYFSKQSCAC